MLALLLAGCGSPRKEAAPQNKPQKVVRTQGSIDLKAPNQPQPQVDPAIKPANTVSGTIREVNPQLRFVILDFAGSRTPRVDQKLNVYRVTYKVAEIRVSGPYRGTTVAADLLAGEAKYGDIVKED